MHHNLDWISELEIDYDMSTFDTDPFEPMPQGAGTIFPFIAVRDVALFFYLLGTSPGVFRLLFRNRHLFRKAFNKRTLNLITEKAL